MSLRRSEIFLREPAPGALSALLLLHMPQDGGRRRLRHKHIRQFGKPLGIGRKIDRRLQRRNRGEESSGERRFCKKCGSALWLYDPSWPELLHPHASAIDTPLPVPVEHTHVLLDSRADWVEVEAGPRDKTFEHYPDESIAAWHERTGSKVE